VTEGSQVVQAAREVTSTIPIIFVRVGDAVGAGFAASLARPGGNLTGLSLYATEQGEKRLELLREILPGLTKAAMLASQASILKGGRVVFNIKANDYRLIALVQYRDGVLMIRFFGTHEDYDKVDAEVV